MSTFMPVRIQSALQGKTLPWSESNQPKKALAPTKNESGSFTLDEANGDGEPSAKKPRLGGDSTDLAIEEEEVRIKHKTKLRDLSRDFSKLNFIKFDLEPKFNLNNFMK